MDYPLIVDGKDAGVLSVTQDGLFTVFEAKCEKRNEMLRISVYGQGKEGYLGIMQPWSGGLYLKRKFSKSRMKNFPENIEYAAPAGLAVKDDAPKPLKESRAKPDESGLCWYRCSDGSLVCNDGKSYIVALPVRLKRQTPGTVLREIDGRLYMLFRY